MTTIRWALPAIILSAFVGAGLGYGSDAADQPVVKRDKSGNPDARFLKHHEETLVKVRKGGYALVLLGDFLTADFRGHNKNQVGAIFEKAFGAYRPIILGDGGDFTQHTLWRIQNGELDGLKPTVMMLMIGGCNGSNGEAPERILAGVKAIITSAREKVPGLKVLLLSVLPWDANPGVRRQRHEAVNALLPQLDDGGKTVLYLDISAKFVDADQRIPKEIMPDAAHLSDLGYQMWADAVAAPLAQLMKPVSERTQAP